MTVTTSPTWPATIPQWLRPRRVSPCQKGWRSVARSTTSITVSTNAHSDISRPTTVMALIRSCISHGSAMASTTATTAAISSRLRSLWNSSRRQRTSGPIPSSNENGIISAIKRELKNGSPIEMLPSPSSLCISGSSVPSSTTSMAAISSTLLPSNSDSRDHSS